MTNHDNRSASRAKFTLSNNYVTLEYDDANTGERTKREFFIGWNGGCVREAARNNGQVCRGLASTGNTLMARDPDDLLRVIRQEYGAMRRAERAVP
jgi:hypothetical protein